MEINIIPKFLDSALTSVGKEIGCRLADIVSLAFTPIIKAKAVRDKKLELFLLKLDDYVKNIPEENLIEPPLNIVGQALEDIVKYYHDEEYLREYFAKLIASSMNKMCYSHPSFIKVIEQLSSEDAKFISELLVKTSDIKGNRQDNTFYFSRELKIIYYSVNTYWEDAIIYFVQNEDKITSIYDREELIVFKSVLSNLHRLGLISISNYASVFFDAEKYYPYEKFPSYYEYTIKMTKYGLIFADTCC